MTVVEEVKYAVQDLGRAGGISVHTAGEERIVMFVSDLDATDIAKFRAVLADALGEADDVRADLSQMRTLDPIGIRELLRAQAVAARLGKSFAVIEPSAIVRMSLDAADAAGLLFTGETSSPPVR